MNERIPPLREGKNIESKESPELFRASLGFDFIFSKDAEGKTRCYCIEINGHDSGVLGVASIPDSQMNATQKVVAGVRANYSNEYLRKATIAEEVKADIDAGHFDVSDEGFEVIKSYVKKSMNDPIMFENAYKNPHFIQSITLDKRMQEQYIPEKYRPRVWHPGDSPVSNTGYWVVKFYSSRAGQDVHVVTNERFEEDFLRNVRDVSKFSVQEFIPSSGADLALEGSRGLPASMRLLMDFRYLEDGSIKTDYQVAYQRVANPVQARKSALENLTLTDYYVVNRKRGATSVAASPNELHIAEEVAREVITKIAEGYARNQKLHEEGVEGQVSLEGANRYSYWTYVTGTRRLIFEYVADSIVDADEAFEKEIGKHPALMRNVSCTIEAVTG